MDFNEFNPKGVKRQKARNESRSAQKLEPPESSAPLIKSSNKVYVKFTNVASEYNHLPLLGSQGLLRRI